MPSTDTPSPNKIRPMVSPGTFQITSRGRVAFAVMSANILDDNNGISTCNSIGSGSSNMSNEGSISSMINYLSPEYVSCLGKKVLFNESDIEKVSVRMYTTRKLYR